MILDGINFQIEDDNGVGTSQAGTFSLNPDNSPKAIDTVSLERGSEGLVSLGIYEIVDENTHRVCFAPPGADRPTKFECPKGSRFRLHVWTRVTDDAAAEQ